MSLVQPRFLSAVGVSRLFPSLCTIQVPAGTMDKGDIIKAPWADLAGHVGLPCRLSPASGSREVRRDDMTYSTITHWLTLQGLYTAVLPHMRAMVDGIAHEIETVDGDGEAVMTRLGLRRIM